MRSAFLKGGHVRGALYAGEHAPELEKSSFVADSATLVGRVTLGENSVVMFGAVLRADRDAITLGEGSNLQDNVVVHGDPGFPARIGAGVSVGHSAVVHGATVRARRRLERPLPPPDG